MTGDLSESAIQDSIKRAAPALGVLLFRNNSGVARRRVRFGLAVGSSDLIGLLVPSGRFIAIEVKSASGKPTEEQLAFLDAVRAAGGFGAIVRSLDEARDAIARARSGGDR